MLDWILEVFRKHPETVFFFVLGIGYLLGKISYRQFQPGRGNGYAARGSACRAVERQDIRRREAVLLPAVPLCHRLPHRAAILSRTSRRRSAAGCACRDCRHHWTDRRFRRWSGPSLRCGHRRRPDRWSTHRVRYHRDRQRRHQPALPRPPHKNRLLPTISRSLSPSLI